MDTPSPAVGKFIFVIVPVAVSVMLPALVEPLVIPRVKVSSPSIIESSRAGIIILVFNVLLGTEKLDKAV